MLLYSQHAPIAFRPPATTTSRGAYVVLHLFLRTELPVRLGPPDPCSTAVHMEPFSTSAFKVLT